MLPVAGPDSFAVSFTWSVAEYQELQRLTLQRKLLIRLMRPVAPVLTIAAAAALPLSHFLAHVPWAAALAETAPWMLLFGFWWLLAAQSWRLPPTVRGKDWNEVPEDRAITPEAVVADGGFGGALLRWHDIDYFRETPLLFVMGRGRELVAIPRRALTPGQTDQLRHHWASTSSAIAAAASGRPS